MEFQLAEMAVTTWAFAKLEFLDEEVMAAISGACLQGRSEFGH